MGGHKQYYQPEQGYEPNRHGRTRVRRDGDRAGGRTAVGGVVHVIGSGDHLNRISFPFATAKAGYWNTILHTNHAAADV